MLNDYELRQLYGVVDGGINLLRAQGDRLTGEQRQRLDANFPVPAPDAPVAEATVDTPPATATPFGEDTDD